MKVKHFGDRIVEDLMQAGESWKRDFAPADADPAQLEEGVNVELEHTRDPVISLKISIDHLAEHEEYYTALSLMEQLLKHGLLPEFLAFARSAGIKPKLRKLSAKHRAKLALAV